MNDEFFIVPSLAEAFTYYLFRDGIEVKFSVENQRIKVLGRGYLLPKEIEFIRAFFL
jgi:hypothetical protein